MVFVTEETYCNYLYKNFKKTFDLTGKGVSVSLKEKAFYIYKKGLNRAMIRVYTVKMYKPHQGSLFIAIVNNQVFTMFILPK